MNSLRCHFEKKKKKGDSLWPWFGTLSLIDWVTSSLGLVRGKNTEIQVGMMVTGDICVKAYTPSTVFMFKLATSNNFVFVTGWQDSISIKCCNASLTLYM